MLDYIGWIATAMFGLSYVCKHPTALRLVQATAALLWITYGFLIHANPVVVSNMIVAVMAVASVWLERRRKTTSPHANDDTTHLRAVGSGFAHPGEVRPHRADA